MKKVFLGFITVLLFETSCLSEPTDSIIKKIVNEVANSDFMFETDIESINTNFYHTKANIRQIRTIVEFQKQTVLFMERNPINLKRYPIEYYRRTLYEISVLSVCMNEQYRNYLKNNNALFTFKFTDKHGQPIDYIDVDIGACRSFGM